MMDQGSLFFDPHHQGGGGNMLFLGSNDQVLQGSRSMMGMEENLKRRSFFITQDDMYDEEYYDEQTPEKKRRLTADQVHQLEKSFETENKLEPDPKTELAKKLGLQPRQVAVWFQNRRARWKTKQLERDYDVLKASYDSLLANYDSILKDNHKLKSEVITITKKLDAEDLPEAKGVSSFPNDHDHGDKCGHVHLHPSEKEMSFNEDPNAPMSCFQSSVKVEDRLSSGSGGSAVVDDKSPQLVDSGDSYFPSGYDFAATTYAHLPRNAHCMGLVDEVHSEDDVLGHEDGRKYFSDVFSAAAVEAESEEGVPMGWWVWS